MGYALYQSVTSMFDVFAETGSVMGFESWNFHILWNTDCLPFDLIKVLLVILLTG